METGRKIKETWLEKMWKRAKLMWQRAEKMWKRAEKRGNRYKKRGKGQKKCRNGQNNEERTEKMMESGRKEGN